LTNESSSSEINKKLIGNNLLSITRIALFIFYKVKASTRTITLNCLDIEIESAKFDTAEGKCPM